MEEKIKMSREELEEKLSGEEAKDKAVENIVKMSKDTGADPLTATLYNYAVQLRLVFGGRNDESLP